MKTLEQIEETYNKFTNNSYYNKGAHFIADELGLKMVVGASEYKKHFADDKDKRTVFKITLKKDSKQYTFDFGQSIAEGNNEPTLYGVLCCLQKYEVGTFEEFCEDYGYNEDSRKAEKIYKAVVKEYKAMQRLFNDDELEILRLIN